jgi:hypothetical protein
MSKQNAALTKRWFELWSTRNLEIADEIIDPDYAPEWIRIPKKGPEQVKHEVRYFRGMFPDLCYEIIDITTQANKVWVRYQATGTHQGAAWGFEATGKQVTCEGVTIFTIGSTGKISDLWGMFCFYDIFTELGLVPPWWELGKHLDITAWATENKAAGSH